MANIAVQYLGKDRLREMISVMETDELPILSIDSETSRTDASWFSRDIISESSLKRANLFINWPSKAGYDLKAIMRYDPEYMLIIYDLNGYSGSKELHEFINNTNEYITVDIHAFQESIKIKQFIATISYKFIYHLLKKK